MFRVLPLLLHLLLLFLLLYFLPLPLSIPLPPPFPLGGTGVPSKNLPRQHLMVILPSDPPNNLLLDLEVVPLTVLTTRYDLLPTYYQGCVLSGGDELRAYEELRKGLLLGGVEL